MSEAMFDLMYIIDFLIRIFMMMSIISGIIYWIRGPQDGN
ncbi:MAG: hypothetical protein Unbinned2990contig1001_8 [Prokaryotic dsDNA virus sp.]|nr:MAG: hypothetical protein Unbinned2990contig1001_8 [Prokaryotic dsDNA virus sp.]